MSHFLIAFIFSISSVSFADTKKVDSQKCGPTEINKLYDSTVKTICAMNIVADMIDHNKVLDTKSCATSILPMIGTGAILGVAVPSQAYLNKVEKGVTKREVLFENTKANRLNRLDALEKETQQQLKMASNPMMMGSGGSTPIGLTKKEIALRMSDPRETLEVMLKNPNNHVLVDALYGTRVGPNKYFYNAAKSGFKGGLAIFTSAYATSVAIMIDEHLGLGAKSLDCGQVEDQYITREQGSSCQTVKKLSPRVMNFLSLPEEEQAKIIKDHPQLCRDYMAIADNLNKDLSKYSYKKLSSDCSQNGFTAKVQYDDKTESEIHLKSDGSSAEMIMDGQTYTVQYSNENGRRVLKSVTGQNKVNQSGVYGAAYQYNFPPKSHQVKDQRFQKVVGEVTRQTMALESMNAFTACNQAGASGGGSTGVH